MVAVVTACATTDIGCPPPLSPPSRRVAPVASLLGVEAAAHSMPQEASTLSEPGKNLTHAAAAATTTTSERASCFQTDIWDPDASNNQCSACSHITLPLPNAKSTNRHNRAVSRLCGRS